MLSVGNSSKKAYDELMVVVTSEGDGGERGRALGGGDAEQMQSGNNDIYLNSNLLLIFKTRTDTLTGGRLKLSGKKNCRGLTTWKIPPHRRQSGQFELMKPRI